MKNNTYNIHTYIYIIRQFLRSVSEYKTNFKNPYFFVPAVSIFILIIILIILPNRKSISDYYDEKYIQQLAANMADKYRSKGIYDKENKSIGSGATSSGLEKAVDKSPIIKKIKLSPNRDYAEGFFYLGNNIVARQKIYDGKIIEQSGKIPDGKVKFYDDFRDTYGYELYDNGKLNGISRTFYKSGELKEENEYQYGRLISTKKYYNNGKMRLTVDYTDARDYEGQKEVGIGKIYFKTGKLKYEWNITKSTKIGYKKSYSEEGKLISALYYDSANDSKENK